MSEYISSSMVRYAVKRIAQLMCVIFTCLPLHAQDLSIYGDCLEGFYPDSVSWEHMKYDIFRHRSSGMLGYFTCAADSTRVFYSVPQGLDINGYIDLGYYGMDDNRIYVRIPMASGNMLYVLEEADFSSFISYAVSPYAKDKYSVFYLGEIVEGADPVSFEVIPSNARLQWPPLARDKNHIYAWGQVLEDISQVQGLREYLEHR
jgi:hypothetical protein